MDEFRPNSYGDRIHKIFDDLFATYDPDCIGVLSQLTGSGPALELGIGTGRIALPLRASGVEVHGIDASEKMLDVLKRKTEADPIQVTLGDFSDFSLDRRYPLIYVVFNTIYALTTQEDQIRCFYSVARHLTPGGKFVVEAFRPNQSRFVDDQTVRVLNIGESKVELEATEHDPVEQTIVSQRIYLDEEGIRLYPVKLRYIWASEMDLMARLTGFELAERWGSWQKTPYSSSSPKHISVYRFSD
jgi:SAM-dependent methyltransferase